MGSPPAGLPSPGDAPDLAAFLHAHDLIFWIGNEPALIFCDLCAKTPMLCFNIYRILV